MSELDPKFVAEFLKEMEARPPANKKEIQRIKARVARRFDSVGLPSDGLILRALTPEQRGKWEATLRQKPMRSQSGVAVIAVMSSPEGCPHGKCVFCPGGPEVDAPQSYTGFEPSTMRARRHGYDPYKIVRGRLEQLAGNGHPIDKVDLIVQGGTFPARQRSYQDWFIASIYKALNDGPGASDEAWQPYEAWQSRTVDDNLAILEEVKLANETAECRAIGLTVETKPDWCFEPEIDVMLAQGVTRVEIGLQTFDDETLKLTHRGHTVEDGAKALRLVRDAGIKVCVHTMPGLPRLPPGGTMGGDLHPDPKRDHEDARIIWRDQEWRPDMLKVYPTLVVHEGETPLKMWWQQGRYQPYDTAKAREMVSAGLRHVPEYCRIQRVDRDIPTTHVDAGVQNSNLRQLAEADADEAHIDIRELRVREAGSRQRHGVNNDTKGVRVERAYEASESLELFLSIEDPATDVVLGFLRLRKLSPRAHRSECQSKGGVAMVRELKVYGQAVELGEAPGQTELQHRGLGKQLMAWAEEISFKRWGVDSLLVIAGVGVKEYYRHLGYTNRGPYVAKDNPCQTQSTTSKGSTAS